MSEILVDDAARKWVARVLGVMSPARVAEGPPARGKPFGVVRFTKAQLAWRAARQGALTEIARAGGDLASVYESFGLGADFLAEFDAFVAPLQAELNGTLDDLLDAVRVQIDPAERRRALALAHKSASHLQGFLQTSAVVKTLESHPVAPATFRAPLARSIDELLLLSEP